jgi:hypothetical protein
MPDIAAQATHKTKAIPPELTQQVMAWVHPDLYLELRIACLRRGRMSVSEFLHDAICAALNRPDMTLDRLRADPTRDVARQLSEDAVISGGESLDAPMDDAFPEAAQPPTVRLQGRKPKAKVKR